MTSILLVATSTSLLKVDTETEQVDVLDDRHGLYYGITWDRQHYLVAARWYPKWMPTSQIERPRLLVLDANFNVVEVREFGVRAGALHQILFRDEHLLCTCSRDDSVVVYHQGSWTVWYPSSDRRHHGRDTHHFNSVWIEGDRLFVVGHNNGPSDIWEFSWPERHLIEKHRIGLTAHNVWREGDSLAVCNSGSGTLENLRGEVLATTGGFPRGVVIGLDRNIIGVSWIANRSNRKQSPGRLQVFSKDWTLEKEIDLGLCGQVTEVRSLGEDLAHNGLPLPSLTSNRIAGAD
ncbi:MAG: hypothetical protein K8J08_00500 [Thermoanaerobaculia bacterium]|nr:hypothetical protein [Thermoanaerobaculia bacterium]